MKKFLIAVSSAALFAAPAQAQLIGGSGGVGGVVGSTIGGGASGGFPDIGGTLERTRSSTRGTLDSAGSTSGDQRVDRRSGRVEANRRADASGSAGIGHVVDNPVAPLTGNASASGNASGEGNASAQLVGTDAVRGIAQSIHVCPGSAFFCCRLQPILLDEFYPQKQHVFQSQNSPHYRKIVESNPGLSQNRAYREDSRTSKSRGQGMV